MIARSVGVSETGVSGPAVGDRLMDASRALEGAFLQYLTQALRSTVPNEGHADAPGAELYGSLLDEHLSQMLANHTSTGIAEALYRQLSGQTWDATHQGGRE